MKTKIIQMKSIALILLLFVLFFKSNAQVSSGHFCPDNQDCFFTNETNTYQTGPTLQFGTVLVNN